MTKQAPDWVAIRKAYECERPSLSALERTYGVSRTAIRKRAAHEHWFQVPGSTPPVPVEPLPLPLDALSIAKRGLHQLAQHLQADTPLDIKEHKLLSDALAQYVKVLVIAPQEESSEEGLVLDIGKLPAWKRMELRRLLAADEPHREVM